MIFMDQTRHRHRLQITDGILHISLGIQRFLDHWQDLQQQRIPGIASLNQVGVVTCYSQWEILLQA